MNVKINPVAKKEYPSLKIYSNPDSSNKDYEFIVLFHAPKCGVVISDNDKSNSALGIGHYSEIWDMTQFVDYDKELILKNT